MFEPPVKKETKEVVEEKENIIVDLFKKLLALNFLTYGGKKDILK